MDPLDLIAGFLDTTRKASTRAADVATIKALLIELPVGHWMGRRAYHALRQVFEDLTEAAEVRQAATQAIYELPPLWYFSILEQERDPLYQEDQLQHHLVRLRQAMTVSGLRRALAYAYLRDPRDPQVLAILAEAARHPDPAIRAEVPWHLLASCGELGVVVHALHDAAPTVRTAAAEALGYQGVEQLGVEGLSALEGALADPDPGVRGAAQVALRRLGIRPLPALPLAPPDVPAPPAGTTRFAWAPFLAAWSWHLLQEEEVRATQPDAVIASGWVGSPGATEAQLAEAEQRLGRRLPPTYRAFLHLTNGWPCGLTEPLVPVEQVDLFQAKEPGSAWGWIKLIEDEHQEDEEGQEFDLSEADHRVYGAQQDTMYFHHAYLQTAFQISESHDGYVYLLNPEVVTPEGEWEAWILGSKILGAQRWPSFWEMVQEESRTQFPGVLPSDAEASQEGSLPSEE